MGLYRRKGTPHYWVRFRIGGNEVRKSTGTSDRKLAEEFEQRLRETAFRQVKLGEGPIYTWDDATSLWFEQTKKRDVKNDKQKEKWFDEYLKGEPLNNIDSALVTKIKRVLTAEGKSPGTINKYLAFLRAVLNHAHDAGLCARPARIKPVESPDHEPRVLTADEAAKVLAELPEHARSIATFALETGLRSSNVFKLRWRDVDLKNRHMTVAASSAKGKRPIGIPLSRGAVAVLRGQRGKHDEYVFPDQRGRAPVTSIKTTWLKACKRAGLEGLRFHDLRHTWASRKVAEGVPLGVVKDLGAWSSLAMVERYTHLRRDDLAAWVDHAKRTKKGTGGKKKAGKRRTTRASAA